MEGSVRRVPVTQEDEGKTGEDPVLRNLSLKSPRPVRKGSAVLWVRRQWVCCESGSCIQGRMVPEASSQPVLTLSMT